MRAPPALLLATLLGLGCQPEARDVRLTLRLPQRHRLPADLRRRIEVRALGDFPPARPNVVLFDRAGAQTIDHP
ncbi:MAG: hypothetical protein M5U28_10495 [Sandaracinaceae bacterium]|nr:hypothetical protein [Sandaracinaceae bacterium]